MRGIAADNSDRGRSGNDPQAEAAADSIFNLEMISYSNSGRRRGSRRIAQSRSMESKSGSPLYRKL